MNTGAVTRVTPTVSPTRNRAMSRKTMPTANADSSANATYPMATPTMVARRPSRSAIRPPARAPRIMPRANAVAMNEVWDVVRCSCFGMNSRAPATTPVS